MSVLLPAERNEMYRRYVTLRPRARTSKCTDIHSAPITRKSKGFQGEKTAVHHQM